MIDAPMPLSRRRKRSEPARRGSLLRTPIPQGNSLEASFDRANLRGTGLEGPALLCHYTDWDAAENILRSQRFHATAHDCTNDQAELVSADAAILEAIRETVEHSPELPHRILRHFLEGFERSRISASRKVYFVSLSTARDDPHQWERYGARGAGVCLGLRLFRIPPPRMEQFATSFMPVGYRPDAIRDQVRPWLARFVEDCARMADIEHNWQESLDALATSAAAWAVATKESKWAPEHEVRMIFVVRNGWQVEPDQTTRGDGSLRAYVPVRVTRLRRMPVEEFWIGPNQDPEAGREKALRLLGDVNYPSPDRRIRISTSPRLHNHRGGFVRQE